MTMESQPEAISPAPPPTLDAIRQRTLRTLDGWWPVFVLDPIAIRLLWLLVRVWPGARPLAVTGTSLLLGLGAAALFFNGQFLWAVLLYQLAYLLDCVDGKLARLKGEASQLGAFCDRIVNHLVNITCLAGLMLHAALRPDAVLGPEMIAIGTVILGLRIVSLVIDGDLKKPSTKSWSHFVPPSDGWLARHRVLPPGSTADRHIILFLIGPLSGFVVIGAAVFALLDVLLVGAKLRKLLRALRAEA